MWPFESRLQRKRTAIKHLQALIDYREGALDAVQYVPQLGVSVSEELVAELAQEWFFLLKALKIVKEREK